MIIFRHRVNTVENLNKTSPEQGVELDLRSNGTSLYLNHDAFGLGESFTDWVSNYRHRGMIVNTKCEGMEEEIIYILAERGIENYFFLDMSIPFMVKWSKKGFRKMAVRFSEYEPLEFTMKFTGLAEWVWVDCFNGNTHSPDVLAVLQKNFKVCIVSPELQGYSPEQILHFKETWKGFIPDGVCTKWPDYWH
jgi:hypothetical protein